MKKPTKPMKPLRNDPIPSEFEEKVYFFFNKLDDSDDIMILCADEVREMLREASIEVDDNYDGFISENSLTRKINLSIANSVLCESTLHYMDRFIKNYLYINGYSQVWLDVFWFDYYSFVMALYAKKEKTKEEHAEDLKKYNSRFDKYKKDMKNYEIQMAEYQIYMNQEKLKKLTGKN